MSSAVARRQHAIKMLSPISTTDQSEMVISDDDGRGRRRRGCCCNGTSTLFLFFQTNRNNNNTKNRYLTVSLVFFFVWFQILKRHSFSSITTVTEPEIYRQQQEKHRNIGRNKSRIYHDTSRIASGNNSNTTVRGIKPQILSLENRSKNHLFVHIGKAGGSSIMIMVKKSREKCQELMKKEEDDDNRKLKAQVCVLATIPNGRVHLQERLDPVRYYSKYDQFLVNVRDPIDRLISWYNYELVAFQKEAKKWTIANQTGQASNNFHRLTHVCFPGTNGFAAMVHSGLVSSTPRTAADRSGDGIINDNDNENRIAPSCKELAQLCLRGDIMCFGHNYYNYEVYLEEILLRKGLSTHGSNINNKQLDDNDNRRSNNIRIDVIRSEHSMDDFNRTVGLWTLFPTKSDGTNDKDDDEKIIANFAGITPFVQSLYGRLRTIQDYDPKSGGGQKQKQTKEQTVLSIEAATALCKHICTELIVYKLIIKVSDNLYGAEIQGSFDALDQRCGFNVDDYCGTTWTYRDIKRKKKVFDAPW